MSAGSNYNPQQQNPPQNMPNGQPFNWNNPLPNMPNASNQSLIYPLLLSIISRDPNAFASALNIMNGNQNPSMPNMNMNPQPSTSPANPAQAPISQTVNQISSARVITSLDDIKPSEVPVDDTTRIFMTDDLQTIYAKKWDNTGELRNMVFQRVPDKISNQKDSSEQNNDSRFSELENKIESIIQITKELATKVEQMDTNNSKSAQKKGGTTNG